MLEPFAAEPDPAFYVPRPASERAIGAIRTAMEGGVHRLVVLYGPPGIGKSVVLGQVALSIQPPNRCLRMNHGGLSLEDVCGWFARELEADAIQAGRSRSWSQRMRDALARKPSDKRDPRLDLVQEVELLHSCGGRVFAFIDEADEMRVATLRGLSDVVKRCAGALRICVATSSDQELITLGALADVIHYVDPLSETETREYIDSRLQRAQVGAAFRSRLDPKRLHRLHRFSGGNPRRLHAELSLIRIELGAEAGVHSVPPAEVPSAATLAAPSVLENASPASAIDSGVDPVKVDATLIGAATTIAPAAREPQPRSASTVLSSSLSNPSSPTTRTATPKIVDTPQGARFQPQASESTATATPALDEGRQAASRSTSARSPRSRARTARTWSKPLAWGALASVTGLIVWVTLGDTSESSAPPRAVETPQRSAAAEPTRRPLEVRPVAEPSAAVERPLPIPVNINADPWANIWIDGRPMGETPLGDVPLSPGEHLFRAELPSGRVIERSIEINQSQRWIYFE